MKHRLPAIAVALCLLAPAHAQEDAGAALARKVAKAAGSDAWARVRAVSFGWHNEGRSVTRRYGWSVDEGRVTARVGDRELSVPHRGWPEGEAGSEAQASAHKAWVNDAFWAMAALHLAWDQGVAFEDLGTIAVPQLPKLGERRALKATWTSGGYTPGDSYVFYLDDEHRPIAWAFFRGDGEVPKLVTTWERYTTQHGITLPSVFAKPDGTVVIRILELKVEAREGAPASRPTSRPSER